MKTITPNLWFDGNAQEAIDYYVSVFPDSKIISTMYYPKSAEEGLADFQKDLAGKVLTIDFELIGNKYVAINAGSEFKFNEAVSFSIPCKDQFGLSWQVVPENATELLKRPGAFANMMQMKKLIIADF